MKTYYTLLFSVFLLAFATILAIPIVFIWKIGLIFLALLALRYETRRFSAQYVKLFGEKFLVTEKDRVYEAYYQSGTVVARHLCFLHLEDLERQKYWYIPISRLEFSKETFKRLKYELQRFSMR